MSDWQDWQEGRSYLTELKKTLRVDSDEKIIPAIQKMLKAIEESKKWIERLEQIESQGGTLLVLDDTADN